MCGATVLDICQVPRRFTRIIRSHSSKPISSYGARDIGTTENTAALLTRPVIVPNSATAASTTACTSSSFEMSAFTARARPPPAMRASALDFAPASSRSAMTIA
jgi:hypothetical protein